MKKLCSLALLFGMVSLTWAQPAKTQYGEYGIGLGTLTLNSDISNNHNVNSIFAEIGPQATLFGKYHFNDWFGMGAEMSYGMLYADDDNHSNIDRGFAVSTKLFQGSGFVEAHFIRFGKYRYDRKFSLFVKAGAGIAAWDPDFKVDSQIEDDILVEDDAYSSFNYYYGLGCKFRLAYKQVLTVEGRVNYPGANTLDGFLIDDPNLVVDNDNYWGIMVSYSILIF